MKINQTILVYTILWLFSLLMHQSTKNTSWLLLVYFLSALNELIQWLWDRDYLNKAPDRTEIFYDLATIPTRDQTDQNYSEGYYPDDDYSISPRQAENNKFAKILELLGAKPGDTILDLGCGVCPFEAFCKDRGINMVGMTLSSEQVKYCSERGANSIVWDYTKFNEKFRGKFDHVVIMGSSEHVYVGGMQFYRSFVTKKKLMARILRQCKGYFKKDGGHHRIFFSGLHLNPKTVGSWGWHVLERTYGGTLQLSSPELDIEASANEAGLKTLYRRDATKDYYMATVLDKNHFGNPGPMLGTASTLLLLMSAIYPLGVYYWVYLTFGYWMWMFDGKTHMCGKNDFSLASVDKRPATLWWAVFEAY